MALIFCFIYLSYVGFFSSLVIKDSSLGPHLLLYRDFSGDFTKIDAHLLKFKEDLQKYFQPIKTLKIYYDNPLAVLNKSNTRAIFGIILDEKEPLDRILKFCKRFEDIKFRNLPQIPCIYTKVEYKKGNRFNQTVFQCKILPKLVVALREKTQKIEKEMKFVGLMEIEDLKTAGDKRLQYAIPYGETTNEYFLTVHPEPLYS